MRSLLNTSFCCSCLGMVSGSQRSIGRCRNSLRRTARSRPETVSTGTKWRCRRKRWRSTLGDKWGPVKSEDCLNITNFVSFGRKQVLLVSGARSPLNFLFLFYPLGGGYTPSPSILRRGPSECMHFPQIPILACLLVLVSFYYQSAAPIRLLALLSVPERTMPASCEVRSDSTLHSWRSSIKMIINQQRRK